MVRYMALIVAVTLAGSSAAASTVSPVTFGRVAPSLGVSPDARAGKPKISRVSTIVAGKQVQTFEVDGSGFGTNQPYFGDSSYFWLYDLTGNWRAGCGPPNPCGTTLNVTSWTDNQIVVAGFGGQTPNAGDRVLVLVWNAQTGKGPATKAVTVKGAKCTANPSGTGLLADGDFSRADDPGGGYTVRGGQKFAPRWQATGNTIEFYSSLFKTPNGECSVDLDGTPGPGGIKHSGFATTPSAVYTVNFLFSGNGACNPVVKTMEVDAAGQSAQFTFDTSNGNNAQNGDYVTESWSFTAYGPRARLQFKSLDAKSNCGPVVAGISVSQSQSKRVRR
jgi:Protein of unknown function (DUF642)